MSSILTNSAAITALQSLTMTQKSLTMVQNQVSTGLRVQSASDNAAYWSIATTMKSDNGALGAVKDALGAGTSMMSVANAAVGQLVTSMNQIKNDLVSAQQPGADLAKIGADIGQASKELTTIVQSAAFNGNNMLDGSQSSINLISSFNRSAAGATSVGSIAITGTAVIGLASGTTGFGVLEGGTGSATGSGTNFKTISVTASTTSAQLTTMSADADVALGALQTYASNLGSTQTRLTQQQSFVSALSDALTNGVGSLVDADMNEASTRLQALQTQQQLGVQSLSIANSNSQMILKLFNG